MSGAQQHLFGDPNNGDQLNDHEQLQSPKNGEDPMESEDGEILDRLHGQPTPNSPIFRPSSPVPRPVSPVRIPTDPNGNVMPAWAMRGNTVLPLPDDHDLHLDKQPDQSDIELLVKVLREIYFRRHEDIAYEAWKAKQPIRTHPMFKAYARWLLLHIHPLPGKGTGQPHPAFPKNMLEFYLLHEDKIDELNKFYDEPYGMRHLGDLKRTSVVGRGFSLVQRQMRQMTLDGTYDTAHNYLFSQKPESFGPLNIPEAELLAPCPEARVRRKRRLFGRVIGVEHDWDGLECTVFDQFVRGDDGLEALVFQYKLGTRKKFGTLDRSCKPVSKSDSSKKK
jgi:hypothetical protein